MNIFLDLFYLKKFHRIAGARCSGLLMGTATIVGVARYNFEQVRTIVFSCLLSLLPGALLPLPGAQQTPDKPTGQTAKPGTSQAVELPAEPGEYAIFYTSMGNIVCRLFPKEAPKTVANFVGLAKGTKSWTNPQTGKNMHTPLYSGTTFHRVIPGFMIQGGDPIGTGEGSPGYQFDDEINPDRHFDKAGVLAMANSGPNTNGSQFFITVAAAAHLDGHYSVFGEVVSGQEVADAISQVPRNDSDKPDSPVKLTRVVIKNVAATAAAH